MIPSGGGQFLSSLKLAWFYRSLISLSSCRLFGFVARKQGSTTDNVCHLFAELDPDQPAAAIVNFVSRVMLGSSHKRWTVASPLQGASCPWILSKDLESFREVVRGSASWRSDVNWWGEGGGLLKKKVIWIVGRLKPTKHMYVAETKELTPLSFPAKIKRWKQFWLLDQHKIREFSPTGQSMNLSNLCGIGLSSSCLFRK